MNKHIDNKLQEFDKKIKDTRMYMFTYCGGDADKDLADIEVDELEQFIKEALMAQREELLAFIGKQEDCCRNKLNEYMWFEKLKSEQSLSTTQPTTVKSSVKQECSCYCHRAGNAGHECCDISHTHVTHKPEERK